MRANSVQEVDVVTGAFSYTGKYIAQRLLMQGRLVRTLTGHPDRSSPFGVKVDAFPFNFDRPSELVRSLQGVTTLYNTYWVRFTHGSITFNEAVDNTQKLIRAAVEAGVRRFVHVSITNPHVDSPLPYFSGKGLLEQNLDEFGAVLCHPPPDGDLWRRRYSDQQHRVAAAAFPGVCDSRRRRISLAADQRRRHGGHCRSRRAAARPTRSSMPSGRKSIRLRRW